jgi:hypothetical protein
MCGSMKYQKDWLYVNSGSVKLYKDKEEIAVQKGTILIGIRLVMPPMLKNKKHTLNTKAW